MQKIKKIPRDISWLSFNERVLQEAEDPTVPLKERIKFLGIFSNNLDEFFRVRVAALKRMIALGNKARMHLEQNPQAILDHIQEILFDQQKKFDHCWVEIIKALKKEQIILIDEKKLNHTQQKFVLDYFNEQVRSSIAPLMIENIERFPALNDKSIYLACRLSTSNHHIPRRFALVSIPVKRLSRFVILPSPTGEKCIILLEDIVKFCLPLIFSFFGYDQFTAHALKLTRDAEIDIDNDISTSLIQKIEKGLKNRKKGKPVRLVFDKDIDHSLLNYLVKRLGLTGKDNLVPGGKIHNFKDFMEFPEQVFQQKPSRKKPFTHPALLHAPSVTEVAMQRDVLLHFPYHHFDSIIDLLREAAIDPDVISIKISCYRLAPRSKIINALTNAVRNGKQVTVMLELKARFDEEANLDWKVELEEAGAKVLIGVPDMKVHAKLCLIKKRKNNITSFYGFVSTGNLNEKTATVYGDHCLITSHKNIMADISRVFIYLENPKEREPVLKSCKALIISPVAMRKTLITLINQEIKNARKKKEAAILLKLNSLSDNQLIEKLHEAAKAGVKVKLIIRGICCMLTENKKFKTPIQAISIVDEYLEHARVMLFKHGGEDKMFISSADWMVRNIDHRLEAASPIYDEALKKEMQAILDIQLMDNVKARILDNQQLNYYVKPSASSSVRSQVGIYNFLYRNKQKPVSTIPNPERE